MKRKKTDLTQPASKWNSPRVGLFVPLGETVFTECFGAFLRFQGFHGLPLLDCGRSPMLEMTRTRAAKVFLETPKLTHLLMLDADHIHAPELLPMLARWTPKAEVVAGLNFNRGGDHKPCCYVDDPAQPWDGRSKPKFRIPITFPEPVMEVAAAGTGSMLIARTALEKLDWPYFTCPTGDDWRPRDKPIPWPGEDIGFAANCRRNGVKQYVDTAATSPHLSSRFVTADDFKHEV